MERKLLEVEHISIDFYSDNYVSREFNIDEAIINTVLQNEYCLPRQFIALMSYNHPPFYCNYNGINTSGNSGMENELINLRGLFRKFYILFLCKNVKY